MNTNYLASIHFNNVDLLEIQHLSIKKYVQNCTYIVFNDASNDTHRTQIYDYCVSHTIPHIFIPPEIHEDRNRVFKPPYTPVRNQMIRFDFSNESRPWYRTIVVDGHNMNITHQHIGSRHCASIQYILQHFQNIPSTHFLMNIDADMLFTRSFDIVHYMSAYNMAIFPQYRAWKPDNAWEYVWPNIWVIDFKTCPNIHTLCMDGCFVFHENKLVGPTDTGGESKHYLDDNKSSLAIQTISSTIVQPTERNIPYVSSPRMHTFIHNTIETDPENKNGISKELIFENILHLRNIGSNWRNVESTTISKHFTEFKDIFLK